MSEKKDDSDAPEELTLMQGIIQEQEIRKSQRDNRARKVKLLLVSTFCDGIQQLQVLDSNYVMSPTQMVAREAKERRRLWAERKKPHPPPKVEEGVDVMENDSPRGAPSSNGMLPEHIVQMLADREKQVFTSSDSEEEEENRAKEKPPATKKRKKMKGLETVILKDLPSSHCAQNSLDFLNKRKMQVPRSAAVLNNSTRALRLISTSALFTMK